MERKEEPQRRRLATVKEACAYVRVGMTKLYDLIGKGEIAAFKLGARTLIDLDTVDAYVTRALVPILPKRRPTKAHQGGQSRGKRSG